MKDVIQSPPAQHVFGQYPCNTKPHQLRWGDQERGLVRKALRWLALSKRLVWNSKLMNVFPLLCITVNTNQNNGSGNETSLGMRQQSTCS